MKNYQEAKLDRGHARASHVTGHLKRVDQRQPCAYCMPRIESFPEDRADEGEIVPSTQADTKMGRELAAHLRVDVIGGVGVHRPSRIRTAGHTVVY